MSLRNWIWCHLVIWFVCWVAKPTGLQLMVQLNQAGSWCFICLDFIMAFGSLSWVHVVPACKKVEAYHQSNWQCPTTWGSTDNEIWMLWSVAGHILVYLVLEIDEASTGDVLFRKDILQFYLKGFFNCMLLVSSMQVTVSMIDLAASYFQSQTSYVHSSLHFPSPAEMMHWLYPSLKVGSSFLKIRWSWNSVTVEAVVYKMDLSVYLHALYIVCLSEIAKAYFVRILTSKWVLLCCSVHSCKLHECESCFHKRYIMQKLQPNESV